MEGVALLFWIIGGLALGWWGVTHAHWHPLLGVACPILFFGWGLFGLIKMQLLAEEQRTNKEAENQVKTPEQEPNRKQN